MAENAEEIKISQLPHVKETVLKKRKNNDQWAINKRSRLERRRQQRINEVKNRIKKPDEFVRKFREKVLFFSASVDRNSFDLYLTIFPLVIMLD